MEATLGPLRGGQCMTACFHDNKCGMITIEHVESCWFPLNPVQWLLALRISGLHGWQLLPLFLPREEGEAIKGKLTQETREADTKYS